MEQMTGAQAYEDYQKLVEEVYQKYNASPITQTEKVHLQWWTQDAPDFDKYKEAVNLWTYWQGFDTFKNGKKPQVRYLLVGQDWGSIKENDRYSGPVLKNINAIRKGNPDRQYYENVDDKNICVTDKNLIELFKELGYGSDKEGDSIRYKRYPGLFFTNFCLGYRSQNMSGGLTKGQMAQDEGNFLKLYKILNPKVILCLDRQTYHCIYKAFHKGEPRYFDSVKSYPEFLNALYRDDNVETTHVREQVIGDGKGPVILPLAHCGSLGTLNRVRISRHQKVTAEQGFAAMQEDWRWIGKHFSEEQNTLNEKRW